MKMFYGSIFTLIKRALTLLFVILLIVFIATIIIEFFNIIDTNGVEVMDDLTGEIDEHAKRWSTFWNSVNIWLERVWMMSKQFIKTSFWILMPAVILSFAETWFAKKKKKQDDIKKDQD